MLESAVDKSSVSLSTEYCSIDNFKYREEETDYYLCRLIQIYRSQVWTTDIIFKSTKEERAVYIHVDCSGDVTRFEKLPEIRSRVVRQFINSGKLKEKKLPITTKPVEWNSRTKKVVISAINGEYDGDIPVVFLSRLFDSAGYIVDADELAKHLAGMAYTVTEGGEEVTAELKEATNNRNPYNGSIGIYYPGTSYYERLSDPNGTRWNAITKKIITEVTNTVMAQVDKEAPTWTDLHNKVIATESQRNREFIDEVAGMNDSLEGQLAEAKQRIARLSEENHNLRMQIENLLNVINNSDAGQYILSKAQVEEFFEGEQYDLVVTALTKALQNSAEETRSNELLKAITEANPLIGNGKDAEEKLKRIIKGDRLTDRDFDALRQLGFEVVNESTHYKLVYIKDKKYWFSISKTPSDFRENKNLLLDILRALSIYK